MSQGKNGNPSDLAEQDVRISGPIPLILQRVVNSQKAGWMIRNQETVINSKLIRS